MQVEPFEFEGKTALRVSGRLDAANSQAFADALLPLLQDEKISPVLDLSGVDYISSSGLRALLQAAKQLQQREARLTLVNIPDPVHSVLALSGFGTFMTIRHPD